MKRKERRREKEIEKRSDEHCKSLAFEFPADITPLAVTSLEITNGISGRQRREIRRRKEAGDRVGNREEMKERGKLLDGLLHRSKLIRLATNIPESLDLAKEISREGMDQAVLIISPGPFQRRRNLILTFPGDFGILGLFVLLRFSGDIGCYPRLVFNY